MKRSGNRQSARTSADRGKKTIFDCGDVELVNLSQFTMRVARHCLVRTAQLILLTASLSLPLNAQGAPTLQRAGTIGCDDCGDARQFSRIQDVDINSKGEVLVVDGDAPNLRVFDATGRLTWAGGRVGSGPGEYRLPIRGKLLADGSIIVVDMTLRRITVLAPDHSVRETVPIGKFAAQAWIAENGTVLVGADDFNGKLDVLRWKPGASIKSLGSLSIGMRADDGTITFPSIVEHASGTIAAIASPDYVIRRFDSTLAPSGDMRREVARVRRTPAEESEARDREARRGRQLTAEERRQRKSSPSPLGNAGPSPAALKPHFAIDALRVDDRDRLWVRTMRGDETRTVFDLFNARGAFVSSVTLPHQVIAWTSRNGRLVAAIENDDGYPRVVTWTVR
jgi:hypothetical protein